MSYLAEQNIIGSLLMDMNSIQEIYDSLRPEMFTSGILGRMYVEFLRAYDNNQPMDTVILNQRMCGTNLPAQVVSGEIKECITQTVTSANLKYYASIILDEYKARTFGKLLNEVRPSPEGIQAQIGALITELEALKGGKRTASKTLRQIVAENQNLYFQEFEEEKINTGFPKLDDLLGGLEGGDVIVIGARPAVGKSAFVTQIAANLAGQGKRVGFYNLEMQDKQVYERFVVNCSGISLTRLRRAKRFLGDEQRKFKEANEFLCGQDIVISTGSKSISEIRNESRHMDYDIIIIDYLQLVRADVRYQSRASEVGAISKAVKALAMELNIPVIALSQLNRVSEMKETREPTMAELREAGDIEQDASIIALLWNLTEDRQKKGIKIDKNRQGETGKQVLGFNGDQMRFEETEETIKQAAEWKQAEEKTPFD